MLPQTVNKLYLDTEDRVHAQLTRISHEILTDSDGERGTQGRQRGLGISLAFRGSWKSREQGQLGSSLSPCGPTKSIPYYLTPKVY